MAKKKFYAVKAGRKTGIFLTWEECREQVEGFSGAAFQGFPTKEQAEAFLMGETDDAAKAGETAVAYVDGSYNVETGEYGCGIVFYYQGEETHISRKGTDTGLASMRNVAGEILGARLAMEEAVKRGAKKLTIWYDYQGIAAWCLGEWKTNKEGTRDYKAYYDSLQNTLDIQFQKVQGHSGDAGNDLADALAKQAVFGEPAEE
ncbi:MAG: ribonuclease H family protein [Lachnospiraceae bacterium]|nr:ribonuclease H family protein [Lachnospiraceae bacterium]